MQHPARKGVKMSDNFSEIWIARWLGSFLYLITRTVVSQVIREPAVLHY
jgi:hypothetical protein